MREYLIRTSEKHGWPGFHRDRQAEVFMPPGFDCTQIDGWGDFRMRCGPCEVSFSGEDAGWQITIDGPIADSDAEALIATLIERVGMASGEACEAIQIT